ncbi:hypothetical protein QBC39DRAFT_241165, partial [Podospora conica]
IGSAVLFEITKKVVSQKPLSPFNNIIQPCTLDRYINTWKRVLRYILCTKDIKNEGYDDEIRPIYEFT